MLLELFALGTLLFILWRLQNQRRYKGYPPGPPRFPIVGSLPILMTKSPIPAIAFKDLAKTYGNVMFLSVGQLDTVVFTDHEAAHEVLVHDKSQDRCALKIPIASERSFNKELGMLCGNGDQWNTIRKFTSRTLREFGFGRTAPMDFVINEELDKFIKHTDSLIESSPGGILQFKGFFDLTVINVLWRLVTGENYALDDPRILHLLRISNDMVQNSSFAFDLSIAFPILRNIFPKYFRRDEMRGFTKEMHDFAWECINEHRSQGTYASNPKGFVDCFLEKIDEAKVSPETYFNDEQLLLTILDLIQGGGETTSKTLCYGVLYMMLYPKIQKRVQDEIDSEVPKNCTISISLKSRLPYCHATILETMRYSCVIPFPPIRAASEDFYFRGYFIRKGTALMPNMQTAHFDENVWGDPYEFRPERFLTSHSSQGDVDSKTAELIFPFGGGKRVCVGKALAENTLFLYFTTFFRNYETLKVPGPKDPSIEPDVGMINAPKPFEARVVKRLSK